MRKHIIRIFVSSTFDDMKIERNILRDRVFPQLTKDCEKSGWLLEYVDLRWGISKEASDSNNTMQICLDELRRCQKLSPRPNFLVLYGEHAGWHPTPEVLNTDTFEKLLRMAETETEKIQLQKFYTKDTNAIPAYYRLTQKDEEELVKELLRRAHNVYPSDTEIERLSSSATMQEIYAGALEVEDAKNHVVAYVRTFSNPAKDNLRKYRDIDSNEWATNLDKLQSKLDDNNLIEANLDYTRYKAREYDNVIYEQLYEHLKQIVEKEIKTFAQKGELELELESNEEFRTSVAQQFVGREETIDTLMHEITTKPTVLLQGESGSGKTALMAKLSSLLKARNNRVVHVFVGNSPNLTKGKYMAKVLAAQLSGYDAQQKDYTPADLYQVLSKASPSQPTYIFIDSLDSLHQGDLFRQMAWMPEDLHSNVHILCSQIPSSGIASYAYATRFDIPKLSDTDVSSIVQSDLAQNKRCITPEQRKTVEQMLKMGDHTPLYAKLLSYMAMQLRSDDYIQNIQIAEGTTQLTTKDLLVYIITSLTQKKFHDERLVRLYLQALSLTFYGVSDDEMSIFLANDKLYYDRLKESSFHQLQENEERRVPPIIISRLKSDLDALLIISCVEDKLVYRWRHNLLAKLSTEYLQELPEFEMYDEYSTLSNLRTPLHEMYMQQMRKGNVHAIYELQHLQTYTDDYFNLFTDLEYLSYRIANGLTDKLGYIYHNTRYNSVEKNIEWNKIKAFEIEASRFYEKGTDAFDYLLKYVFQYSPTSCIGKTMRLRYGKDFRQWRDNLLFRGDSTEEALKPIFEPITTPSAICDDGRTAYGVDDGKIWKIDLIENTKEEVRFNNLGYVVSMKCAGPNARYWAVLSDKRFIMLYDSQERKVLNVVSLTDYIMDKWEPEEFCNAKPQTADGDAYFISYNQPIRLALQYQDGTIEIWEEGEMIQTLHPLETWQGRLACISGNGKYCYMYVWNNAQVQESNHEYWAFRNVEHSISRFDIDSFIEDSCCMTKDFFHGINNMAASEDGNTLIFSEGGYTLRMRWDNGKKNLLGVYAHNHRIDLSHNHYAISPDGKKAFSYGETDGVIVTYDTDDMLPKYLPLGNFFQMYLAKFSHSTRFAYIQSTHGFMMKKNFHPAWYVWDTGKDMYSLSNLIRSGVYSMDVWKNHLLFSIGGDPVSDCNPTVYHMDLNTKKITPLNVPLDVSVGTSSHNISFSRDGHIVLFTREDTVYVFKDLQYVTCHKVEVIGEGGKAMQNLEQEDIRDGYFYRTSDNFHSIYKRYDVPISEFIYSSIDSSIDSSNHSLLKQLPVVPCKSVGYFLRAKENGILIYPTSDNPGFAFYFRGKFEISDYDNPKKR